MGVTNRDKQTPYDLCVSEAALDLFHGFGYKQAPSKSAEQVQAPPAVTGLAAEPSRK